MASCFKIVNKEYTEKLKNKSKNENTMNSMEWWKNFFKKWANERKSYKFCSVLQSKGQSKQAEGKEARSLHFMLQKQLFGSNTF